MSNPRGNQPAFPAQAQMEGWNRGLTVREYLALGALQGMLAAGQGNSGRYSELAKAAARAADALIDELNP